MISMQTLEIRVFPVNWLDIFGFDAIYVYDYSVFFSMNIVPIMYVCIQPFYLKIISSLNIVFSMTAYNLMSNLSFGFQTLFTMLKTP